MKKKILALLIGFTLAMTCVGCGTTYQEATNQSSVSNSYGRGYFTVITEWGGTPVYKIVYANDTKVKYLVVSSGYQYGMTPLYNSDGTLQVYDGE